MIGVSVRTIDRYIRRGELSSYARNGRVWLDKNQVTSFSKQPLEARTPVKDKTPQLRVSTIAAHQHDGSFYKDLYEEAKKTLGEYHQKLEHATYRIGQLESQILNVQSSPAKIPEPVIAPRREDSLADMLKRDIAERDRDLHTLKEALKKEHTNRTAFAVLTYALLAVIPALWFILSR